MLPLSAIATCYLRSHPLSSARPSHTRRAVTTAIFKAISKFIRQATRHPAAITTLGVFLLLIASGCASSYRGGGTLSSSNMPRGRLVQTFSRTSCTGALANELAEQQQKKGPIFVDFVQGRNGLPFLVERDRSDSWLLISNSHQDGETIVFQAIEQSGAQRFLEYRIAGYGSEPGQLFVSAHHTPAQGSTHWFSASASGPSASCKLQPVTPLEGAPAGTYDEQEAHMNGPGWGFDGSSFKVGDNVLVDMGGRSVLTRIIQASGTAYFVRLIHDPEDPGRWIDPATITGYLR